MRVAIIYQSVTGNTRFMANKIKEGINASQNDCDLFDIKDTKVINFEKYDLIGFGAPTFCYREPIAMKKFISNLSSLDGLYAFLFSTCQNDTGNFFHRMMKNLSSKGIQIISTLKLNCPSSFIPRRGRDERSTIKGEMVRKAISFGETILNEFILIKDGMKSAPRIKRNLFGSIVGTFLSARIMRSYIGKIHVNEEICTKCGICVKSCYLQEITLDPFPTFAKKKCEGCFGCINNCPVLALDSKSTRGKSKYTFDISLLEKP